MKGVFFLLCGFTLFFLTNCQWSNPIELGVNYSNPKVGIFSENITGQTFIAFGYTETTEYNIKPFLCIVQYSPTNIPKKECFSQQQQIENITLSGLKVGNNIQLYLAYSARRKLRSVDCNDQTVNGCYDVFYTESQNAGGSWSVARQVPRLNLRDPLNRVNPTLMAIAETGRVYLSYTRWSGNHPNHSVMMLNKPSGSIIFSNELLFGNWTYPINDIALQYSLIKGQIALHMFFQKEKSVFSKFLSVDMGNKWTETALRKDSETYSISLTNSWKKDQIYIVSIGSNDGYLIHWMETDDTGLMTWETRPLKFNIKDPNMIPFITDLQGSYHRVFLTGIVGTKYVSSYVFCTEDESMIDMNDRAPSNTLGGSSFYHAGGAKIRIIHNVGSTLYLSSYKVVDW